jgi:hypothetical protein
MTDAAACALLTVGTPVVAITALQELRLLLDVLARGSALTDVSMPSKEGCDAPKESVIGCDRLLGRPASEWADYVALTGAHGPGDRRRRALELATLSLSVGRGFGQYEHSHSRRLGFAMLRWPRAWVE